MTTETEKTYKILLVGDGGVGKTTLVSRYITEKFVRKYLPTIGVDVACIPFSTSIGSISLNIWDCGGQEKFGCLRQEYYVESDAAIVMFDVTAPLTYKNTKLWVDEIKKICGKIPIILVANKVDMMERMSPEFITFHRELDIPYYEISVKSAYNYEKPFMCILKLLTNNQELKLVDPVLELNPPADNNELKLVE